MNQSNFLQAMVPAAQASQRAFGVPASVIVAQAILESGWGTSGLAQRANNFFGIKAAAHCDPDQSIAMPTAEYVDGQRVTVEADFARYGSAEESCAAHGRLLSTATRYAPAMAVRNDAQAFARQLQACGYSTAPNYAAMLSALIREFDLTQYDLPGAAGNGKEAS